MPIRHFTQDSHGQEASLRLLNGSTRRSDSAHSLVRYSRALPWVTLPMAQGSTQVPPWRANQQAFRALEQAIRALERVHGQVHLAEVAQQHACCKLKVE